MAKKEKKKETQDPKDPSGWVAKPCGEHPDDTDYVTHAPTTEPRPHDEDPKGGDEE